MDPSMTPPSLYHSPSASTASTVTIDNVFSPSITSHSLGANEPAIDVSSTASWVSNTAPWISDTAPKDGVYRVMQAVAINVVEVITTHYTHQDGLANRALVLEAAYLAVSILTEDPRLQQEYYRDVVYEVDRLIMQLQRSWPRIQAPTPEITRTNDNEMSPPTAPPSAPPPAASTTRATPSTRAAKKNVCDHCGIEFTRSDAVKRHWRESCTANLESTKMKKKKLQQERVLFFGNQQR